MGRKRRSGLSEPEALPQPQPPALSLAECLCPVCRELLAEPVTPPCGHSLCLGCFQQTVAISNLNCPLCRRRLSNWARAKARGGSLVNTELQEQIRQQFPQQRSEEASGQEEFNIHDSSRKRESYTTDFLKIKFIIQQGSQIDCTQSQPYRKYTEESKSTDEDDIISNSDSTDSISPFQYGTEQEPVCSLAQSELAQETPATTIINCQQESDYTGEHSARDNENEMVGVCSGVWKGRERCKEDVPLSKLKLNSINSNGEDDQLGFATLSILGHELDDYAHNSTSFSGLDNTVCAAIHSDEEIALKPIPSHDQSTKHQFANQTPIQLETVVKRKILNSSEAEGETCSSVKKRKVCPNESCESTEPSHEIFHEEQLSDWEKKQSENLRMEEQDRLLALRLQKKLDKETIAVDRKRGSPDGYLLRTNKSAPINCEKGVYAKNQTSVRTQNSGRISGKLQRSRPTHSARGRKQRVRTDDSSSKQKSRIWQHPAGQSQRTLRQGPLNYMDANSAALIPIHELRSGKKQQTIVEMFQKHGTN
ncbi:E3 ubiquitin-protein ligase rnf168 isoform X3 [Scyliorhinus canicula]|uniref:E3 ubiquitin-protein ligase rnf168 isoform X3 n=1 Tax=Scyliorhinus canicula TaxID=7830 RepID=UPI0018F68F10|nr:E3 ubiquitin-protein ligase rnf168 isoform X3 [Scyliorhinus canicula]